MTATELIENKTVDLYGNLTIESGGSLTLRNVTLALSPQYNGSIGIMADKGSSLTIQDSRILSSIPTTRYFLIVQANNFVMTNSKVSEVGWCALGSGNTNTCVDPSRQYEAGPNVVGNMAIIENNTFSDNVVGLSIGSSYTRVIQNTFSQNGLLSLYLYSGSHNFVSNNTMAQDRRAWLSNTWTLDSALMSLLGVQNSTVVGNRLSENTTLFLANFGSLAGRTRMDGIRAQYSQGNVLAENTITVGNVGVFLVSDDGNSVVSDNTVLFGETGVIVGTGSVNSRVTGNDMQALADYGARSAVEIMLSHNSIIANNRISGDLTIGIDLDHTSNSSVLNNQLSIGGDDEYRIHRAEKLGLVVLVASNDNSLMGNTVAGLPHGLILTGSDGNNVTQNTISADYSVTILGSSSNRLYLNNLFDLNEPGGGPYDDGDNSWQVGTDGNYWSHFTGVDASGNGIGDVPYQRMTIPPRGVESLSRQSHVQIASFPIPDRKPVPTPLGRGPLPSKPLTIENQTAEIEYGALSNNVTIINSTVYLGRRGSVGMGCSVTIIDSRLINVGYGFVPLGGNRPCTSSLTVKNSTLDGAYLVDANIDFINIQDSVITNGLSAWGLSVTNALSVRIINTTFSNGLGGILVAGDTPAGAAVKDELVIADNRILDMIQFGIYIQASRPATLLIADNTIMGPGMGRGIIVSGNAVVRRNLVEGVRRGIQIMTAGNVIFENNVTNTFCPIDSYPGNPVYHNNLINYTHPLCGIYGPNGDSFNGEGNYWGNYTGKDFNFDGIGDSTYEQDQYPFMQPNGWLTRFWLTVNTNYPSIAFEINGTDFETSTLGNSVLRLGYSANYVFSFPQKLTTSNGNVLWFEKWADGYTNPTRTMSLSGNMTIQVVYTLMPSQTTTTTTSTSTSTIATSTSSQSVSLSTATSSAVSTSGSFSNLGGQMDYLPYVAVSAVAVVVIVALAIISKRRR